MKSRNNPKPFMTESFEYRLEIESRIGYTFKDPSLLELAFIHRSYANEHRSKVSGHNERLEFFGDAILGLIVSEFLYLEFPNHPEGELSYLRSRLVEASSCAHYLKKTGVEPFLLLGAGESMNKGKGRMTILADLFEAMMGAIYLDGGIETARHFFFSHFKEEVLEIIEKPFRNWKALLQDVCQKKYHKTPVYTVLHTEGPDHLKTFEVEVSIEGKELSKGVGSSKKEAEQNAAKQALERMNHV